MDSDLDFLPLVSILPGPRGKKGEPGTAGNGGTNGLNAFTTTTAAFVMPAPSASATVAVASTAWIGVGQCIYIEGAGYGIASAILSGISFQWTALDLETNTGPATGLASGKKVSPGGFAVVDASAIEDLAGRVYVLETAPGGSKNYFSTSQPSGGEYNAGDIWYDTDAGNRPYRWDGTAWVDAQAIITLADFGTGLKPIRAVSALPGSGALGEFVLLTTDNKLYRGTGSGWTKAIATGDLTGEIDGAMIVDGTLIAQKLAANSVTAQKVGANQIITQAANIADAVITDAKIANLSAAKVTAGDMQAVNLGYSGRIFHTSHPANKFRTVDFNNAGSTVKTFDAGNCLSTGYAHAPGVTFYGPGHVGWTSGGFTVCPDSDGRIRIQAQGRLLGYTGLILLYAQKNGGTPFTLAAITSSDGGNAYNDCTRVLNGWTATDMLKVYVAPAGGDGIIVPGECRVELDVTVFNW